MDAAADELNASRIGRKARRRGQVETGLPLALPAFDGKGVIARLASIRAAIGHFTWFLYGPKLIQELLVAEAILAVEFAR